MEQRGQPAADSTATLQLIAAWLFVGIPLLWGVYKTAINAAALF